MITDLQGRIPSLEVIATRLNMTPRTLQRRLTGEKTTFRTIVAGVQRELVAEIRKTGKPTQSQIANVLGYSDVSSFRRAMKKASVR